LTQLGQALGRCGRHGKHQALRIAQTGGAQGCPGRRAGGDMDSKINKMRQQKITTVMLEPIPKVVESDESFVIRYPAPELSTGECRDVEI
jgi:hypothetical protein